MTKRAHWYAFRNAQPYEPKVGAPLSPMQMALMELMISGAGTKQAAAALGMDQSTAATHLSRAKVKLGAKTRYQAVAMFAVAKVKEEI